MNRASANQISIILGLIAALWAPACTTDGVSTPVHVNEPPQVWLAAAPPEGSTGSYTVKLYWGGWDPDGEISHYQFFITDNEAGVWDPDDLEGAVWTNVVANDSTFTFSADLLAQNAKVQVAEFQRSHTFFIRAVDTEGKTSARPAYRSFTSRTLSPEVFIRIPTKNALNPALLPQIATYKWQAVDYVDDKNTVQEPDSVQWALVSTDCCGNSFGATIDSLRNPNWKPLLPNKQPRPTWQNWVYYRAPNDAGKSWTTPLQAQGSYIFAIRAKDEAGAVTPVLDEKDNVRRVSVGARSAGPAFSVYNIYLGNTTTQSCSTPFSILDIPAGVALEFELSASAESYGGQVSGYRYGWDIADLTDPDQWEIDYTPFVQTREKTPSRTFFFGTHTFTAEVIDNSGYCSRMEIKVNVVQFTLERNLLIVDDFESDETQFSGWDDPVGRGVRPNDAQHDAFWLDMVRDLDGFDEARDVITTKNAISIPLTKIASYKSLVWSSHGAVQSDTDFPLLYQFVQFRPKTASRSSGKVTPNLLALAMAAGVHVMVAGQHPTQNVINRTYASPRFPVIWQYELAGQPIGTPDIDNPPGDQSFAFKELCLETMDYALQSSPRRRGNTTYCSVVNFRKPNSLSKRDDTLRKAIAIDQKFSDLELRPEAAGTGKFFEPSSQGLDVEVYNPQYFADYCPYVPKQTRLCFQPIYGIECFDTAEPTYGQPVAFWTSALADRVADVPGAIGARSCVFGFPPVYTNPEQFRSAMEVIMFDEWKLPRKQAVSSSQ